MWNCELSGVQVIGSEVYLARSSTLFTDLVHVEVLDDWVKACVEIVEQGDHLYTKKKIQIQLSEPRRLSFSKILLSFSNLSRKE